MGNVTFAYKESATDQLKHCTLSAQEFIRRFLQHVLPPRFIKVRYYGLLSPAQRQLLQKARQLLGASTTKLKRAETHGTAHHALSALPSAAHTAGSRSLPEVAPHETPTAGYCRLPLSPRPLANPLLVSVALCLRPQKNQPHWLALSTSDSTSLPSPLFFSTPPLFPARLTPSAYYSNSK